MYLLLKHSDLTALHCPVVYWNMYENVVVYYSSRVITLWASSDEEKITWDFRLDISVYLCNCNWALLLPCQKCTFTMYAWGSLNIYTIQRRSYFSMSMSVKYVIRGLFIVLTVWYSSIINYNIIIVTMLLVIKIYFVFAFIMCRWCRYIMWKLNVKIILFWYKFRYQM